MHHLKSQWLHRHPELTCLLRLAKCVCTGSLRISPNHCRASSASCCDKSCTGCPRHRTPLALGSIQRGAQTSFALSTEDCKLLLSGQLGDPHSPGESRGKNSNKDNPGLVISASSFKHQQKLLQKGHEKAFYVQGIYHESQITSIV